MEEMNHNPEPKHETPPWQPYYDPQGPAAPPPEDSVFSAGKRESRLAVILLLWSLLLCNSLLTGGGNLGFALGALGILATLTGYLLCNGAKLRAYPLALLVCSGLVAASYARSGDGFVKFVLFFFLTMGGSLGLCLLAGKERWRPGSVGSLMDSLNTLFGMGVGKLPDAFRGLRRFARSRENAGKWGGAVALGLVAALPVLAILIPLLARADAAFSGLLERLPRIRFGEILGTLILGGVLWAMLYAQGAALGRGPQQTPVGRTVRKGIHPVTVNTALAAVDLVYVVYLASQLAYFAGGFAGILPEDFTVAAYARRGFFEMAWLCVLNLAVMILGIGLVAKTDDRAPLATRLLCLFAGLMTLFLVASASAKMFLYIGSFGLTRLRVLTEVIMVFLGLTTLFVCLWLFLPKFPYMKAVMLAGLLLGAAVAWADVDTVVAWYNVTAYQSGQLESVDMEHLSTLSDGAVPYVQRLTEDPDPQVAEEAQRILREWDRSSEDLRGWNAASAAAREILDRYPPYPEDSQEKEPW